MIIFRRAPFRCAAEFIGEYVVCGNFIGKTAEILKTQLKVYE